MYTVIYLINNIQLCQKQVTVALNEDGTWTVIEDVMCDVTDHLNHDTDGSKKVKLPLRLLDEREQARLRSLVTHQGGVSAVRTCAQYYVPMSCTHLCTCTHAYTHLLRYLH